MPKYNVTTKALAKKLIAIAAMQSQLSSCSGVMATQRGDHMLIYGDSKAIRAWASHEAQLIVNGKSKLDPAEDTPYYALKRTQALSNVRRMQDYRSEEK